MRNKDAPSFDGASLFQRRFQREEGGVPGGRSPGYQLSTSSCKILSMRMNLRSLIVITGICIVLAAVPACSRTDTSDETSTSYNSPTQIPINTPIASRTQSPVDLATKTQIRPNSANPTSTPDMASNKQK